MKRPAVFFDRDNTLIVSDGYLGDPAKVVLINGAADAVARARRLGYAVVVFSNQSGVARGLFSEEDVQAVNKRMDELLAAENAGAIIDRHEFCPFHPEGKIDVYARESDRRKPKPGMILSAADKLALDLSKSWVIGDAPRDVEAGKAAGCRAILFTDGALKASPAAAERSSVDPDYVVSTLAEAVDYIERNAENDSEPGPPAAAPEEKNAMLPPVSALAKTTPRVAKVAIGSKYVPPAGNSTSTAASREEPGERAARKSYSRSSDEEEARPPQPPPTGSERMESLLEQIFLELRRQHEHRDTDFSVSKLLAGVVQVLVLATLFLAYIRRDSPTQTYLMIALVLQTLTISLLIMSRQK
jgi:D-glycero-D-manno-heptose 1,7-bisphosphate phosphatase